MRKKNRFKINGSGENKNVIANKNKFNKEKITLK